MLPLNEVYARGGQVLVRGGLSWLTVGISQNDADVFVKSTWLDVGMLTLKAHISLRRADDFWRECAVRLLRFTQLGPIQRQPVALRPAHTGSKANLQRHPL
jgi:hypothetical protein